MKYKAPNGKVVEVRNKQQAGVFERAGFKLVKEKEEKK